MSQKQKTDGTRRVGLMKLLSWTNINGDLYGILSAEGGWRDCYVIHKAPVDDEWIKSAFQPFFLFPPTLPSYLYTCTLH